MKKMFMIYALVMALGFFACSRKPKTSCVYGDNIPADILDATIQIGDSVVHALKARDFNWIYDAGSESLKKAQTREQFKLVLEGVTNNLGTLELSSLQEAYYLTNKAGKKYQVVSVPCNLEMENVNDIYQVPPNSEVVAMIYSATAGKESIHIFIELIKEGGSWKLISIVPGLETLQGKNLEVYINMARQAREQNKPRLAILYYKIALLLSDYSPNVLEYVSLQLAQEMAQVKADYIPLGTPQLWTSADNEHFEVHNVDVFIENSEAWINIDWSVESFADTQKIDASSEKLLEFAFTKFLDAKPFFAGIIVTAHSKDPRLAAQVYRKFRRFSEINP